MLNKPVTDKMTSTVTTQQFRFAISAMQGWRKQMEDAHTINYQLDGDRNKCLCGVFDGHGGQEVAEIVADKVPAAVTANLSFKRGKYCESMQHGLCAVEDALYKKRLGYQETGTTANMILLTPGRIHCCNCGDSRAVLCRAGKAIELSKDQRPTDPEEHDRIVRNGGTVEDGRVGGALAVCRAVGDFQFKPQLPRKGILNTLYFNEQKENFAVDNQMRRASIAAMNANQQNFGPAAGSSASQSVVALGVSVPSDNGDESSTTNPATGQQQQQHDDLEDECVFDPDMVAKFVDDTDSEAGNNNEDNLDASSNNMRIDEDDLFSKALAGAAADMPTVAAPGGGNNEDSSNSKSSPNNNEQQQHNTNKKPRPPRIDANDVLFTRAAFKAQLELSQLTAIPDVYETNWEAEVDEFIILACDGVWDMFTSQEVVNMIRPKILPMIRNEKNTNSTDDQLLQAASGQQPPSNLDIGLVLEEVLDRCVASQPQGAGTDNFTLMIVVPTKKWTSQQQ